MQSEHNPIPNESGSLQKTLFIRVPFWLGDLGMRHSRSSPFTFISTTVGFSAFWNKFSLCFLEK